MCFLCKDVIRKDDMAVTGPDAVKLINSTSNILNDDAKDIFIHAEPCAKDFRIGLSEEAKKKRLFAKLKRYSKGEEFRNVMMGAATKIAFPIVMATVYGFAATMAKPAGWLTSLINLEALGSIFSLPILGGSAAWGIYKEYGNERRRERARKEFERREKEMAANR